MTKTKVRFHLAEGPNKHRWQVKTGDEVDYYDPEDVVLSMHNCKLKNRSKEAKKIHDGANKNVCAWIECEIIMVWDKSPTCPPSPDRFIRYNPRQTPHWVNDKRENLDNKTFDTLLTYDRLIMTPKKSSIVEEK
jgi:hypothetical protein|tara:strand:- start:925 stop:1326 length:402 start_codon:yes stop_codon:yes gene_type:complete